MLSTSSLTPKYLVVKDHVSLAADLLTGIASGFGGDFSHCTHKKAAAFTAAFSLSD